MINSPSQHLIYSRKASTKTERPNLQTPSTNNRQNYSLPKGNKSLQPNSKV